MEKHDALSTDDRRPSEVRAKLLQPCKHLRGIESSRRRAERDACIPVKVLRRRHPSEIRASQPRVCQYWDGIGGGKRRVE